MSGTWASDGFRDDVRRAADLVLTGAVRDGAMTLWELGLSTGDLGFAGGLWQIWGRITDEYTHSDGNEIEGQRLAREAARELRDSLGDPQRERAYCDRWIHERLDII